MGGGINTVKDDKRNHLPVFGDAGEELQHRKGDHTPTVVDGRIVPWINPREQDLSTRSTKAGKTTGGYGLAARSTRLGNIPTTAYDFPCHAHQLNVPAAALQARRTSPNAGEELATFLSLSSKPEK